MSPIKKETPSRSITKPIQGNLVGIDYGQSRIGLALSSVKSAIALSFKTIKAGNSYEKSVDVLLEALMGREEINGYVVGLPLHLSGKESPMSLQAREFAAILEKRTGVPVILWDERLTSSQASQTLKSYGMKRKKQKEHIDALAAMFILQSYLDARGP